ncbi:MAG: hypothetical protein A3D82_01725 [Candidatus Levybacteria bacterium RIFCSPHIGHO2_02_FULL_40_29]|nr:MAG: hypothetical protein UT44_C0015G0014 [Candidatus Levybacteria bacterium GW2011_GWA1_39_32]OGH27395.1 MAG: hypothetical protein A3D82_01725 [Candidatus Levybacteria bacterium RIFCSPHIGHO2_02_FULL_40_29]
MRVFIFGAGASKGSQHRVIHDSFVPPLSNELFDPKYSQFAHMVGLMDPDMNRCRDSISKFSSFEEWLTDEWEKVKDLKEVRTRDAKKGFLAQIAFYIWITLVNVSKWTYENERQSREDNGYQVLMSKLLVKDEPFGLISFNYDLILDYAYKDVFRLAFHSIDDYLNNNYVKPHGSVNWLLAKRSDDLSIDLEQEHNMDTRVRLDTAIKLMFRDSPIPIIGLHVKDPDHRDIYTLDDLLRSFKSQYFYPLIFLPLTSKDYTSVHGFEEKILAKGNQLVSEANEIYLIGYKANDDIIKSMLKNAPDGTILNVVGNKSASDIMKKVLAWGTNIKEGKVFDAGFYRFVSDTSL